MPRVIAILVLLVAFAAQTFHQAAIVVDYYVRTAAYEKACVNKARPQMHCHGQCQMARKLREQEQKERQAPELKLDLKTEVFSPEHFFTLAPLPGVPAQRSTYGMPDSDLPVALAHDIFHPPLQG